MQKIGLITVLLGVLVLVLVGCNQDLQTSADTAEVQGLKEVQVGVISATSDLSSETKDVEGVDPVDNVGVKAIEAKEKNTDNAPDTTNLSTPANNAVATNSSNNSNTKVTGEVKPAQPESELKSAGAHTDSAVQGTVAASKTTTLIGPYTGLNVQEIRLKRPMMVMVENSPKARPQVGLDQASIVYEFLAEGGISRFMALYYETFPERVGPVRSTRPYFIHTALEYNALLLHAGASTDGYAEMSRTKLAHLDEISYGKYYWRDSSRKAPHNLYTGWKRVQTIKTKTVGVTESRFSFSGKANDATNRANAKNLNIVYWGNYTVKYQYDPAKKSYLRYIGSSPHLLEGGKKLYADNIFVQYVDTKTIDKEGRLQMQLTGSGKAILLQNGYAYRGTWVKQDGEVTSFLQANGQEFTLNPGQTWIQVVPRSTNVDYQ